MKEEVAALVGRRVALEFEDRRDVLGREVRRVVEAMNVRGALRSGMTIQAIQEAVAREARVRVSIVWTVLARALSTAGEPLTPITAQEAKALIAELTREHSADLLEHLRYADRLLGRERDVSTEQYLQAAFDRIDTEVDFSLLSSSAASDQQAQTVNIYQSQGIVQTGPHAAASLVVNLGTQERQELAAALSAIREAIQNAQELSDVERANAVQLATETEDELKKDEPNKLKIRSGLQGLATSVQTLAAAPDAYRLLKGAASLLGLHLP